MTRVLTLAAACTLAVAAHAQFGFGGQQINTDDIGCSKKYADINYAGDSAAYHNLDVYLPKGEAKSHPVMIHIYGSAWFSNSSKGMADLGTICKAYLEAGYAVVCPNHRSSMDAKWPAQCHDIKAVIRWVRANAKEYGFDTSFIGTSGFSSGGHLSSVMGSTSGTKTAKVGTYEIDLEGNVGTNLNESSEIDVAVSWSGPIDLQAMDCGGRPNGVNGSPEEALIGEKFSEATQDRYLSVSATPYLNAGDPPMIGFHGTQDNVVPYCQAEAWDKTYTAAGVKHEFVTVEGGGHGFNMYSADNLNRAVKFINDVRTAKNK